METKAKTDLEPQEKPFLSLKNRLYITAGFVIFIILVIISTAISRNTSQNTPVIPTPTDSVQHTVQSVSPSPQQEGFYTLNNNSLVRIETVQSLQSPVIDPRGFIYFASNNTVIKFIIQDQSTKVLYTNTKLGTKIANITLYAQDHLYISIIADLSSPEYTKQPDKSSYVIDLNLSTGAIRTIGPLKSLSDGHIAYLMQSQDNDILNIVQKQYCRETGEISSYGSGSATFITNDGAGCNGDNPYLVGALEGDTKLVLATPDASNKPDDFTPKYSGLYTMDIFSGQTEGIFDLTGFYPVNQKNTVGETTFGMSPDKTIIYCIIAGKLYAIDRISKQVVRTIDFSKLSFDISQYTIIAIANDTVYLVSTTTRKFATINAMNGKVTEFSQDIAKDPTVLDPFTYLGILNNQPVFSISMPSL